MPGTGTVGGTCSPGGGGGGGDSRGGTGDGGEAKFKPHDSQNWPVLAVPQRGQGSATAAGAPWPAGRPPVGIAPVGNAPVPGRTGPARTGPGRTGPGAPVAEEGAWACGLPGLVAMRMPHTSQKSSLAES